MSQEWGEMELKWAWSKSRPGHEEDKNVLNIVAKQEDYIFLLNRLNSYKLLNNLC